MRSYNPPPLSLIYRGSLTSCQYSCNYCPFALQENSRAQLAQDAQEVQQFTQWVQGQTMPLRVFFTPWGEALIRKHYQEAVTLLSHTPSVESVAIQTNLHFKNSWLEQVNPRTLALWCTFHPTQTPIEAFLERCQGLSALGIRYSVGVVALKEHFDAIRQLRNQLPASIYLWLNAYDRRGAHYYSAEDREWLGTIDPWFHWNVQPQSSKNAPCWAGERSIRIDGAGNVMRCHFIKSSLGNIYQHDLADILQERPCEKKRCPCFIGYSQRKDLPFQEVFGTHVLGRVPENFVHASPTPRHPMFTSM